MGMPGHPAFLGRAAQLHEQWGLRSLRDWFERQEPWQRQLAALAKLSTTGDAADATGAAQSRLIWELQLSTRSAMLHPREQKRKGKAAALTRTDLGALAGAGWTSTRWRGVCQLRLFNEAEAVQLKKLFSLSVQLSPLGECLSLGSGAAQRAADVPTEVVSGSSIGMDEVAPRHAPATVLAGRTQRAARLTGQSWSGEPFGS